MASATKTVYRYGKLVEENGVVRLVYATRPFVYGKKKVSINDNNVAGWLKYGWKEVIKADYPEYDFDNEYVSEEYSEDAEKIYVTYVVSPIEG